ncbi:MAG TPA: hypothetical protein VE978_21080 [Chitinophagales bacterium]|nr:hypothetical protein [Chitinophagales bacterium]
MKKLIIIVLAIVVSYTSVAQEPAVISSDKTGWHKIGETTVDFKKDRDEVVVMGSDRFAALRFKLTDASIDLQDLEVYYESGDKQVIQVRTPIAKGTESRVIDLNGGERSLKKIVFVYKTIPNQRDEKAHVEIWGLKTNEERPGDAKPATTTGDNPGWQKIGERIVDFKKDRDELMVSGTDRFKSIRFKVTDASIVLQDIEVHYENGDKQDIQVRAPISKGSESRALDLNGGDRAIQKIVFVYKTIPNQREERAHLEIWGLKTSEAISGTPKPAVITNDNTGWHKIAETVVDFKKDRDEIVVMGADRFAAIKFKVTDASIELQDLEVYFESGDKQDIQVRTAIARGGESRVIDLNGGERSLKKIVFVYKTVPNQREEKAHLEIWGLKTNAIAK